MGRPPEYLMPVLHSIESEVVKIYQEFPRLIDKEVEWVYNQLLTYYRDLSRGKKREEPLSTAERKQALMDEILNKLDIRRELDMDSSIVGQEKQGSRVIDSLEILYELAFKNLHSSARFWRKKDGKTGYLDFISNSVVG